MRECKDHDLVGHDLVDDGKRKSIQDSDASVKSILPRRGGARKLKDRIDRGVYLDLKLRAEPCTARFVILDLVVDLRDRESMDA